MRKNNRRRHKILFMLVLAMLLQIIAPVAQTVYAQVYEEAFAFQVNTETGKYEWSYNPEKASGKKVFEKELGLKLVGDLNPIKLIDKGKESPIGEFTISADGLLIATIYEKEVVEDTIKPEDTENVTEVKIEDIKVDTFGGQVLVTARVTGAEEGQVARVEILNENNELVDFKDNLELVGDKLEVEFEGLKEGNYLILISVDDVKEAAEFQVEILVEDGPTDTEKEDEEVQDEFVEEAKPIEDETLDDAGIHEETETEKDETQENDLDGEDGVSEEIANPDKEEDLDQEVSFLQEQ